MGLFSGGGEAHQRGGKLMGFIYEKNLVNFFMCL